MMDCKLQDVVLNTRSVVENEEKQGCTLRGAEKGTEAPHEPKVSCRTALYLSVSYVSSYGTFWTSGTGSAKAGNCHVSGSFQRYERENSQCGDRTGEIGAS